MILKNSDGTATHYQEYGDPQHEALVCLHGIGADHQMWAPQMKDFSGAGFFVLAPDLLGHGKSSKVTHLDLEDWENQIRDLLLDQEKERCVLVGVSMGGVIAQSLAVRHPGMVSRLVLADTFGELRTPAERLLGWSQVLGFQLFKLLGAGMLAKGMASTYKAPFARLARDYFVEVSREVDFDQLILARRAINKIDVLQDLKAFDQPTLVLVGDQFGESFIKINRKIAAAIKGSRFAVLEQSMDPSNLVNPEKFNHEVLMFLKEHPLEQQRQGGT